jgi:hypothetical protein
MDAGGLGALIGVSFMAGFCLFYYFYDLYNKRKDNQQPIEKLMEVIVDNPLNTENTPILIKKPSHKKLNEYIPPPTTKN